jgi:hypothetical protein
MPASASRRYALLLVALGLPVSGGGLSAQDSTRAAARCEGKTISAISITPRNASFGAVPRPLRLPARLVGLQHTTTKPDVVKRFLQLEVGRRCTERKRAESERILRLQPFLAAARVRALPDTAGRVRIEVVTTDEIPTVFSVHMRDRQPSAFRFGNGNVLGQGLYLAANVERGSAYRTGRGVTAIAYQAFGRPYTLALVAERAPLGSTLTIALGRPFLTDLQQTAWHAGYRDVNRYVSYVRPEGDALSLGIRRRLWDAGGVRRIGLGRRSAFLGVLMTREEVIPADRVVVITDSGLVADSSGGLGGPFARYRDGRLNAVVGLRSLSFVEVRGFDALTAVQDVATGVQVGVLVGRGVSRLGASDDALFASGNFYAGYGSARSFAAIRIEGEGRKARSVDRWDAIVGSGRLAWYLKPADAHVLIASAEFGGGWRQRLPFQLRLGDRRGGVRGYGGSRVAGNAVGVARVEERWFIGRPRPTVEVGLAGLVDAGRVWAGDAPFGVNSRTSIGAGIGLLLSRVESRRLWRLDLAVPTRPDAHASWEVRLSSLRTRSFWREPGDVSRARAGVAPSAIFTWH